MTATKVTSVSLIVTTCLIWNAASYIIPTPSSTVEEAWLEGALSLARSFPCTEAPFANEHDCRLLARTPRSGISAYVARAPLPVQKLVAVMPDGSLTRAGAHQAVLALDPFPAASFGHLVLVFFVDSTPTAHQCIRNGGRYLGNNECVTFARKNRCHNQIDKGFHRKSRRCELLFLPFVYLEGASDGQREQLLKCQTNVAGFGPCPTLRPQNETSHLVCNPLGVNTRSCSTAHETVRTRCRLLETCDQALLLSGGWNRDHSPVSGQQPLSAMFSMLRNAGFLRNNIKVFYANGARGSQVVGEEHHSFHPAAMKLAMRYHLQKMCSSAHCVDSLVFYLNSPTKSDGTMLLWDVDNNGEADETEVYTIKEFLLDLKDCLAQRVFIIVDQSFAGEVATAVAKSHKHSNVLVFASGKEDEYSWNMEFTKHWAAAQHNHTCVNQVQEASQHSVRLSTPISYDGSGGDIKTTIFGAPCDVIPPFSQRELQDSYLGCQNLPTKIWISKFV